MGGCRSQNRKWRELSAKELTVWSQLSVYTVSAPFGHEGCFCILDEFTEVWNEEEEEETYL